MSSPERPERFGYQATQAGLLAVTLCELGRDDEALEFAAECDRLLGDEFSPADRSMIKGVEGRILARRGSPDVGERLAREAVALLEDTDALIFGARSLTDLAEVLEAGGRHAEAGDALESALGLYGRKGAVPLIERTRAALAALRAASGG